MSLDHRISTRKRIVIIGAAGRLGRLLADALEPEHTVLRLTRTELDLASPASIEAALAPLEYDLALVTAAHTAVDHCESHAAEAHAINAESPGRIARISAAKGAHVTYFSTDFVYGGERPGLWAENDATEPVSVYGASKLAGERAVLAASPAHLVIRISWLFGPGKAAFPEWIITRACAEREVALPQDKVACPTYAVDLAGWLMPLLFGASGPAAGVFNLCNSGACTWQEWGAECVAIAREAGLPVLAPEIGGVPVESIAAFVARRPLHSAMSTDKFTARTGIHPRDWRPALREHLLASELFAKHRTNASC